MNIDKPTTVERCGSSDVDGRFDDFLCGACDTVIAVLVLPEPADHRVMRLDACLPPAAPCDDHADGQCVRCTCGAHVSIDTVLAAVEEDAERRMEGDDVP